MLLVFIAYADKQHSYSCAQIRRHVTLRWDAGVSGGLVRSMHYSDGGIWLAAAGACVCTPVLSLFWTPSSSEGLLWVKRALDLVKSVISLSSDVCVQVFVGMRSAQGWARVFSYVSGRWTCFVTSQSKNQGILIIYVCWNWSICYRVMSVR